VPLYDLVCINGHAQVVYYASSAQKRCRTHICDCGHSMAFVFSVPAEYDWFSESHPVTITNMGHCPVVVTSHKQHERLMRERGLAWASPRRGMPGCWG